MSDGNFNRSLLPHDPFHSGLKLGKAQMRTKALDAFRKFLEEYHTEYNENRRAELLDNFRNQLI